MLEFVEHAFHEVAVRIEVFVVVTRDFAIGFGGNDDLSLDALGALDDVIGIIAFIRNQSLHPDAVHQGQCLRVVGRLTGRQDYPQGIAMAIAGRMNFGAKSTPRPT